MRERIKGFFYVIFLSIIMIFSFTAAFILSGLALIGFTFFIILWVIMVIYYIYILNSKKHKKILKKNAFGTARNHANIDMKKNAFKANWLPNAAIKNNIDWIRAEMDHRYRPTASLEKEINQYITLRLENGRIYIYVNGRRFIQCIRLILNIPKTDVPLYDEVESIDEAAKLYNKHLYQNRIVTGPMAAPIRDQYHNITPKEEFWGHSSNLQTWVEHDYDTRILMSNISFPLLRELTRAGDPKARKVYKEEIAQRLESGCPSVVQYLLAQGYIQEFTPTEFQSILESTNLIKKLSAEPKMLFHFLRSCILKFPRLIEYILLQILELPESKNVFFSLIQRAPMVSTFPLFSRYRFPEFLNNLKNALENLVDQVDEKTGNDIKGYIQLINQKLIEQHHNLSRRPFNEDLESITNEFLNNNPFPKIDALKEKLILKQKILERYRKLESRCSYCGRIMTKGKDICEWCGHKKDDNEGGFFPFPFIFKPPGGGGGSKKNVTIIPVEIKN
ncbi:MAG: hypothetical protein ACFFBH_05485 [Promethearchaeota archaeon]